MSDSDLIIKEDPSQYPIPEPGIHNAVLVDAVDLGQLETPWGPKEKISLIFELQTTDEEGKPFIVGKRFTRSLNEKASLRKFLEKWRGAKYSASELSEGVNLENLIGMGASLFIILNESSDSEKTFANIESVIPYKSQKTGETAFFELKPSGDYTRVINREGYKKPEEYAESVNNGQAA